MRRLLTLLLLSLAICCSYPAAVSAQERVCAEFWNYGTSGYVVDLETGAATSYSTENGRYLSPDQRYALITRGDNNTLIIIDRQSGAEHTLGDHAEPIGWAAGGRRFVYTLPSAGGGAALLRYDLAAERAAEITGEFSRYSVRISTDTHWLTYVVYTDAGSQAVVLVNLDDDQQRRIAERGSVNLIGWSPDGNWLMTAQTDGDGATRREFVLDHLFTTERLVFTVETAYEVRAAVWSPDGTRVALVVIRELALEYADVYLLSAPDLGLIDGVYAMLVRPRVEWSPSGRYLTIIEFGSSNMLLVDASTVDAPGVTIAQGAFLPDYWGVAWSPDETRLLVYHSPGDIWTAFTVFNLQGEMVIDGYWVGSAAEGPPARHWWLTDHHLLMQTDVNGYDALTLFDTDTGAVRQLIYPLGMYAASPQQRLIALTVQSLTGTGDSERAIRFYEVVGETLVLTRSVMFPDPVNYALWHPVRAELILLTFENALLAYDYAANEMHTITTLPQLDGQWWGMRFTDCPPGG